MSQLLIQDGYQPVNSARRAGVLVVNTCGFIGTAREKSIPNSAGWQKPNGRVNCLSPPDA